MTFAPSRFSFGVIYDVFPPMISILNIFGLLLAFFLQVHY